MVWAVITLKSPAQAKSRLSGVLSPQARRQLFFAMASHVIETLQHTRGVQGVRVVTASEEVAEFARELGCWTIRQPKDCGTAHAFEAGVAHAIARGEPQLLLLPGDLPMLSVPAVETLLASAPEAPGMVIAPDDTQAGTNALLCSPPNVGPMRFGHDSFQRHIAAARQREVATAIVTEPALAFDLDDERDLERLPAAFWPSVTAAADAPPHDRVAWLARRAAIMNMA